MAEEYCLLISDVCRQLYSEADRILESIKKMSGSSNETESKILLQPLIAHDDACLYNLNEIQRIPFMERINRNETLDSIINLYRCKKCTMMSEILDLNKPLDEPFFISCESTESYVIDKYNDVYLSFGVSTSENGTILYLDNFSNNYIINLIIKGLVSSEIPNYKGYNDKLTAFVCRNTGYVIKEYHKELNVNSLMDKDIYGLIIQIFTIVTILSKYQFIMTGISIHIIKIYNQMIEYQYDGVNVTSNIKCVIDNFFGASINYDKVKVAPHHMYGEDTVIRNKTLIKDHEVIDYFKIENIDMKGLVSKDLNYKPALNAYIFFILLYNEKNVKVYIRSNLLNIWNGLWLYTERDNVENEIMEIGELNDGRLFEFLKGKSLRYDAHDFIWRSLKNIVINKN